MFGPHEHVVHPRERRGIIGRVVPQRAHHADEADDGAGALRDQDATVVRCALRREKAHIGIDDRLALGPRRLESTVKVLVLDEAGPKRLAVAGRVVRTNARRQSRPHVNTWVGVISMTTESDGEIAASFAYCGYFS